MKFLWCTALAFLLMSCGPLWRSPEYYEGYGEIELHRPILTMEEYGQRAPTHERPYRYTVSENVHVFGAEHTKDPRDAQIDAITADWRGFRPTVALVESRLGFLFRWTSDPVEKFGESGKVADLAQEEGIPYYTWEPPVEEEVAWVRKEFTKEHTALFYILRPYFGARRNGPVTEPDNAVAGTISRRTKWKGLEGSISSVAQIDSLWRADFPGMKDWRDTDDRYGWPGVLNSIAARSNAFRDEHLVRVIIHLARNGERVFVVCGSSHAVKIEEALPSSLP